MDHPPWIHQVPKTSRSTSDQVKTTPLGSAPQSFTNISVTAGLNMTREVTTAAPMRRWTDDPGGHKAELS